LILTITNGMVLFYFLFLIKNSINQFNNNFLTYLIALLIFLLTSLLIFLLTSLLIFLLTNPINFLLTSPINLVGSPYWVSPEMIRFEPHNTSVCIYYSINNSFIYYVSHFANH
jgi:hypothetical protein